MKRMSHISFVCLLISSLSASAQFRVTSSAPSQGIVTAAVNSAVAVTFNSTVNTATVNTASFTVRGQRFGVYPGTFTFPTASSAVFTPATNFLYGERIRVTLGNAILSGGGAPLSENTFEFHAETLPCASCVWETNQLIGSKTTFDVALGDFDADGDLDIFFANAQGHEVWTNDGSGFFAVFQTNLPGTGSGIDGGVDLGDVNGDGTLDAVVVADQGQSGRIFTNDGSGRFYDTGQLLKHPTANTHFMRDCELGDMDGDGDLDLYVAVGNLNNADDILYENQGGIFTNTAPQIVGSFSGFGAAAYEVGLGDFNGDGDLDAWTAARPFSFLGGSCTWSNNGSGVLGYWQTSLTLQPVNGTDDLGVDIGDLDGDGDLDAFVVAYSTSNRVWLGSSSGIFTDGAQSLGAFKSYDVTLGDLDGDGDLDAYVTCDNQANRTWINDGSANFSVGDVIGGDITYGCAVGDLDGDGDLDLVDANGNFTANKVYLRKAAGSPAPTGFSFVVESAHGSPVPAAGGYTNDPGAVITNSVTTPVEMNGTQYVCLGWTMSGNNPVSGSTNLFLMTQTNDAVLVWLWTTNVQFSRFAGPNGSLLGSSAGWYPIGGSVTVTAAPDAYYGFLQWTGTITTVANPLHLTNDQPYDITALFAALYATNGTPQWWLAQYGFTNDFDNAALGDQDADGMLTWQEYVAMTVPTNGVSVFINTGHSTVYGTNYTEQVYTNECPPATNNCGVIYTSRIYDVRGISVEWASVSGKTYSIEYAQNMQPWSWAQVPGAQNLSAVSNNLSYIDTNHLSIDEVLYRVWVKRNP